MKGVRPSTGLVEKRGRSEKAEESRRRLKKYESKQKQAKASWAPPWMLPGGSLRGKHQTRGGDSTCLAQVALVRRWSSFVIHCGLPAPQQAWQLAIGSLTNTWCCARLHTKTPLSRACSWRLRRGCATVLKCLFGRILSCIHLAIVYTSWLN